MIDHGFVVIYYLIIGTTVVLLYKVQMVDITYPMKISVYVV